MEKEKKKQEKRAEIKNMFKKKEGPRSMTLSILFSTLKVFVVVLVLIGAGCFGLVLGVAKAYIDTTPMLNLSALTDSSKTSYIYDTNGEMLCAYAGSEYRDWVSIDDIPDMMQNAVIAIEDVRFRDHNGVDYKRLVSAIINTFRNEDTHGGSTITQQLIKNTILSDVQSYKRKIQEAYLALELETVSEKDKILEAYLNEVYFGDRNYGIKSAAKDYFGKELNELTIRECAMLAGMIQKPNGYNPRLNTYKRIDPITGENQMKRTNDRTDVVINAMYDAGFISLEQREKALDEEVKIIEESTKMDSYKYTYFIEYAMYDVETQLLKQRGMMDTAANRNVIETELRTGGYQIYLTIDPKIQAIVEYEVENYDNYPRLKDRSASIRREPLGDGTFMEIIEPQAAAVVMNHETGDLVAIVGGRNAPTAQKQWNRAYMSALEVGSSIKPIAVYGPALDAGLSPASVAYNIPGRIKGWDTDAGYPSIASAADVVTIRRGVRSSLNVVAARTLMYEVGIEKSKEYLMKLGIPESNINADGPGLALGTTGITPIQMAGAFSTIANNGVYNEPMSFTKVVDSDGRIILDAKQVRTTHRVFEESTSWLLVDMMKDVVTSGTGTRAKIHGITCAGKTGTNSDYSSVCFSGITGYYTASVWIGHDYPQYKLADSATGGQYAAPLWKNFMERIHAGLKDKAIVDADPDDLGIVKRTVCSVSGLIATEQCHNDPLHKPVTDWFLASNVPSRSCNMHITYTVCNETGEIACDHCVSTASKSMLVITKDSGLSAFSDSYLTSIFPNAIIAKDKTLEGFLPPKCHLHVNGQVGPQLPDDPDNSDDPTDPSDTDEQLKALIKEAKRLINIATEYIEQNPDQDASMLKATINQLKEAILVESQSKIRNGIVQLKNAYKRLSGNDIE